MPSFSQRPRALNRVSLSLRDPHIISSSQLHHHPVPHPTMRKGTSSSHDAYTTMQPTPTASKSRRNVHRHPHPLQLVKNSHTATPGVVYLRYASSVGSSETHKVSGLANPFTRRTRVSNDDETPSYRPTTRCTPFDDANPLDT